ncbi:hypothetical protein H0H81_002219 [Sphagnurus paluster]|uniref:MOSC domain-containing protein n=1 Tax=Sphagnurus paluster TaxID=117069 RepID=A0A9P7FTT6_9AGAR|nr:hypothetical protein H0H81_002219 [Sphagnurus paluster]
MSSTFPGSFIDALRLPTRLTLPITWPTKQSSDIPNPWLTPSSGVTLAAVAGATAVIVFSLRLYAARPRSHENSLSAKSKNKSKSKTMPHVMEKPVDGSVRVAELLIHPIKSCRGVSVQRVKYTPQGLENDRKWCIIDAATRAVITAREFPRMVLIAPRIEPDPASPHGGALVVAFPPDAPAGCTEFRVPLQPDAQTLSQWEIIDGIGLFHHTLDGYIGQLLSPSPSPSPDTPTPPPTASSILSTYFTKPVHLVYKGPRARAVDATHAFPSLAATSVFQDMYPLLVLSKESMHAVEEEVRARVGQQGVGEAWREARVELRRFRPNVVFEGAGPFAEDAWEEVALGSPGAPGVTLVSKCARCLLPNVSPDTGERDKAVPYKVIMKFRTGLDPAEMMKPCVGCNGVPAASGEVSVGDVVYVKKMIG